MFNPADLPNCIPVFPLPGALLLPRARLPLHIFEPRYLAMLDDVLKSPHRLIGMIQPVPGTQGSEKLHSVGCAGRVTTFSETDDGRYMLTLSGISRFSIAHMVEGFSPYVRCDVSWDGYEADLGHSEKDDSLDRGQLMDLLARYFAAREMDTDWESLRNADDELLINSLAMLCPLAPEDRQALLEAKTLQTRREILMTLLKFSLHGGSDEKMVQ